MPRLLLRSLLPGNRQPADRDVSASPQRPGRPERHRLPVCSAAPFSQQSGFVIRNSDNELRITTLQGGFLMNWLRSILLFLVLTPLAGAADWPQWLGPHRDNSTPEIVAPW